MALRLTAKQLAHKQELLIQHFKNLVYSPPARTSSEVYQENFDIDSLRQQLDALRYNMRKDNKEV